MEVQKKKGVESLGAAEKEMATTITVQHEQQRMEAEEDTNIAAAATAAATSDSDEDFVDALEELDDVRTTIGFKWGEGMIDTEMMKGGIAVDVVYFVGLVVAWTVAGTVAVVQDKICGAIVDKILQRVRF